MFWVIDKESYKIMAEVDQGANLEKAMAFFERAEEVAETDNFDYAIVVEF